MSRLLLRLRIFRRCTRMWVRERLERRRVIKHGTQIDRWRLIK
jgi:hypothetical protein